LIHDLGKIIDIREEVYRIREKIYFDEEAEKVREQLAASWQPAFKLVTNFDSCPYLYSVKAILNSILFNLISNSIKYRSPERDLIIEVSSKCNEDYSFLKVTDNGLGMNLQETRKDLFKMYKRFHTHIDGKGLGLYLVRIQADTINAEIEVKSELNRGSTFEIRIPHIRSVENQIFFETDYAQLSFDANINSMLVLWKRNVVSEEYRTVFKKVLLTLSLYNSPSWIADLRNQGTIQEEDQKWFIKEVLEQASRIGLKRIGTMGFSDPVRKAYYTRMQTICNNLNIEIRDFDVLEDAKAWLASHMTK
jgi:two-component sensor histidine kinase